MSDIKEFVKTIDAAVNKLSDNAALQQSAAFKELMGLIKTLDTRGDVLLNNINNLGIINKIKVQLERFIINNQYKSDVKDFVGSYNQIQQISNSYFAQFNAKYQPKATIKAIKQTAIESTLNGLFENGIQIGVTDGLRKILQTNINAGGSYVHLTDQLRDYMLGSNNLEGALQRYVKTYATTAINQYTAEYNNAISSDLGLEWYGYSGSLLTTSRDFCLKCVEKRYIHISEFPKLLEGDFGYLGQIPLAKTTGLPKGMMEGTNEQNLVRRRGGWNCGHQMIAVSEMVVPKAIKDAVYATEAYKEWARKNGKTIQPSTSVGNTKGAKQKSKTLYSRPIDAPRLIKPLKEYNGSLQEFVDEVIKSKRTNNTVKNLGSFPESIIKDLQKNGIEIESNKIFISDKKILKNLDHSKRQKGAAIDMQRFDEVVKAINQPVAILKDKKSKSLVYAYASNYDDKMIKIIIEPNYKIDDSVVNLAKSIGVVKKSALSDTNSYQLIDGKI